MPRRKTVHLPDDSESTSSSALKLVLRVPKFAKTNEATTSPLPTRVASGSSAENSDDELLSEKILDSEKLANLEESYDDENNTKEDSIPTTLRQKRKKRRFRLTDSVAKAKRRAERKAVIEAERDTNGGLEQDFDDEHENIELESTPPPSRPLLSSYSAFQLLLDRLLREFCRKDPEQYFTFPVTDSIAPDYSNVISEPMDLSTMRQKLDRNLYPDLASFKRDAELIISNAIAYNEQTTVYFYAAEKLKAVVNHLFGQSYLLYLYRILPFADHLTVQQLGFDPVVTKHYLMSPKPLPGKYSCITDDMTAENIVQQATKASKKVADRLAKRKHKSELVFLTQKDDGSTCLNILTDKSTDVSKRVVRLGDLVSKLKEGTPGLSPFIEDRGNVVVPISYLNYGPYSSFAPQYDSTWASLDKRDSDLLLSTYGDRENATNVLSIRQFVENTGDHMIELVDQLLDTLTNGEHEKTMKQLNNRETSCCLTNETPLAPLESDKIDFEMIKTLSHIGFDMSFVDGARAKYGLIGDEEVSGQTTERKLHRTGLLLGDLETTQRQRLGTRPEFTLTNIQQSDQHNTETNLAGVVVQQIAHLTTQTAPDDLNSPLQLHRAMGIVNPDDVDMDLIREFLTDGPD